MLTASVPCGYTMTFGSWGVHLLLKDVFHLGLSRHGPTEEQRAEFPSVPLPQAFLIQHIHQIKEHSLARFFFECNLWTWQVHVTLSTIIVSYITIPMP